MIQHFRLVTLWTYAITKHSVFTVVRHWEEITVAEYYRASFNVAYCNSSRQVLMHAVLVASFASYYAAPI